jgi:hypothetical protein
MLRAGEFGTEFEGPVISVLDSSPGFARTHSLLWVMIEWQRQIKGTGLGADFQLPAKPKD